MRHMEANDSENSFLEAGFSFVQMFTARDFFLCSYFLDI